MNNNKTRFFFFCAHINAANGSGQTRFGSLREPNRFFSFILTNTVRFGYPFAALPPVSFFFLFFFFYFFFKLSELHAKCLLPNRREVHSGCVSAAKPIVSDSIKYNLLNKLTFLIVVSKVANN